MLVVSVVLVVPVVLRRKHLFPSLPRTSMDVVDLEEFEDEDWEFPERNFFNAADRDADFKMVRLSNRFCAEEEEMILAD